MLHDSITVASDMIFKKPAQPTLPPKQPRRPWWNSASDSAVKKVKQAEKEGAAHHYHPRKGPPPIIHEQTERATPIQHLLHKLIRIRSLEISHCCPSPKNWQTS
jgi:hypothetical protein